MYCKNIFYNQSNAQARGETAVDAPGRPYIARASAQAQQMIEPEAAKGKRTMEPICMQEKRDERQFKGPGAGPIVQPPVLPSYMHACACSVVDSICWLTFTHWSNTARTTLAMVYHGWFGSRSECMHGSI